MNHNCIIILGPTASGKTKLAVETARLFNGEIISIDSRQVYKKLDIGTGKDLADYGEIPYHLIDILEPTENYHVHAFANDFYKAFGEIQLRGKLPVLCGGTGLYYDTVLKKNQLIAIPNNPTLRQVLATKTTAQLVEWIKKDTMAKNYKFDTSTQKRLVRAIEILEYLKINPAPPIQFHELKPVIFGRKTTLDQRRAYISWRLVDRLENGLIEEAQNLIHSGVTHEQLQYFGLEYKFLSYYLLGKITRDQLFTQLETAIHQYAKRQMTWWRKMEREGFIIHWVSDFEELKTILKKFDL